MTYLSCFFMTGEMLFFSWPSWPFYDSSGSELEKNSGQKTREIKNKLKLFNFTEFKKYISYFKSRASDSKKFCEIDSFDFTSFSRSGLFFLDQTI